MGREAGRVRGLSWDAGFLRATLSLLPPRPPHGWPSRRTAASSPRPITADTTRLPDLPPTLKSTTRCVCLLYFMVSAASIISSEERLSKCPSTCPYVPPDTGSVRAGTQGGCRLERKWWMPDPQAGLHGLCTREDPQPSWMEF